MVVAAAELELRVVCVDACADGRGLAEVERRAFDRPQLAGRDQACSSTGVNWSALSISLVAEDVAVACAGQVEVGVVGQVDDAWPCRSSPRSRSAARCRRSACRSTVHCRLPGIALFAVLAQVA